MRFNFFFSVIILLFNWFEQRQKRRLFLCHIHVICNIKWAFIEFLGGHPESFPEFCQPLKTTTHVWTPERQVESERLAIDIDSLHFYYGGQRHGLGRKENHESAFHRDGVALGNLVYHYHDRTLASHGAFDQHPLWSVQILSKLYPKVGGEVSLSEIIKPIFAA